MKKLRKTKKKTQTMFARQVEQGKETLLQNSFQIEKYLKSINKTFEEYCSERKTTKEIVEELNKTSMKDLLKVHDTLTKELGNPSWNDEYKYLFEHLETDRLKKLYKYNPCMSVDDLDLPNELKFELLCGTSAIKRVISFAKKHNLLTEKNLYSILNKAWIPWGESFPHIPKELFSYKILEKIRKRSETWWVNISDDIWLEHYSTEHLATIMLATDESERKKARKIFLLKTVGPLSKEDLEKKSKEELQKLVKELYNSYVQ